MYDLSKMVKAVRESGYDDADAQAKVCQDIVLKAISESDFSRSVTIKGGVVMRSLTKNIRRATQDMDIDFIRYSMSDPSIENFVEKMNCIEGIYIKRIGKIEELRQQDYYGKRVFVEITDHYGNIVESKIDLGVHKHLEVGQEEYCFDIAFSEEGASLLINSKEQMFVEKLRSLLKFGSFSTRYKDIYDMYYQCDKLNNEKLRTCFESYIFSDPGMRENDISDVVRRVKAVFSDRRYRQRVDSSDKRWLDDDIGAVFTKILEFLEKNAESEY
ncbi:nucleotidyl transferase AbiEii/AbiGii toxin family protein [Schaedlerella arabinosiphila]|jgi:predicted nucleotidyltransferase component of viral defense system|uniref:Nucleotidyl transferase AbiEii/AbiGii toxin family protein n=2 Tax=Schaedlerella arabinosiphila TaxID=2044587 RepID=A0A9X5CC11_9FIRM|nr:nucleotidyl transferase AbiEii/AbiGii toxin family protein [Schaedlerella arabinosiphila]MCI9212836.1 nucleotidyl transferase AbiEii/AbiGii toxin family protein [Ruminococcus sp.]MCI9603920.1 nucleotidyl transferase AbiEii/AbiGii toxin family protein [Ruminococcus sp.]NDO71894.1 nucleotidyl transferase AbiEii/AbiGii toxin family protein [Schaedlerella arabinosiphila]